MNRWVLTVVGGVIALGVILGLSLTRAAPVAPSTRQDVTGSPTASSMASRMGSPPAMSGDTAPLPGTPAAHLAAITGVAPPVPQQDATWPTYENSTIGLTVQFPPGWAYIELPDRTGVAFYPPGVDPNTPTALIAFDLNREQPFDPDAQPPPDMTLPQPVTVGGAAGRRYDDAAYVIPTQNQYIEVPHRGGTLMITVTRGPAVNLLPTLEQMLLTVALQE